MKKFETYISSATDVFSDSIYINSSQNCMDAAHTRILNNCWKFGDPL
jgi:hypothetical protein